MALLFPHQRGHRLSERGAASAFDDGAAILVLSGLTEKFNWQWYCYFLIIGSGIAISSPTRQSIPNLHVMMVLRSLCSRGYVNDEGIMPITEQGDDPDERDPPFSWPAPFDGNTAYTSRSEFPCALCFPDPDQLLRL